jgi:predicted regulator of Ras-like GTPase activity (Roadblock/LC7/MglB family)
MNSNYKKETRQLILLGFFLAVAPLVLFPKNFGIRLNVNPFFFFLLEFIWYLFSLFFLLPSLATSTFILYAFATLLFRLFLGTLFGFLLMVMFPIAFLPALKSGWVSYLPAILFQAFLLPFMIKQSLGNVIKRSLREKRFQRLALQPFPETKKETPYVVEERGEKKELVLEVSLEETLGFLKEYPGVEGALLIDSEGLIIAQEVDPAVDEEKIAPLALSFAQTNGSLLGKIGEKHLERLQIFSENVWLNINHVGDFILITLASRSADELLNIRILKAQEAIKKYLENKYPQSVLSKDEITIPPPADNLEVSRQKAGQEEKYVPDLRGT